VVQVHKGAVSRSSDEGNAPGAGVALAVLFLTYVFNYLDSTLIYILFPLVKSEMAMTETQLALLGSTSFVLFYTVLGVPFGRLADRVSRTKMIACGLTVWSMASAATGLMHGFGGLFACRVMVGVGEATLGPAALSLLSDLFAPKRRATAAASFSAGIPIGAGIALFAGGALGARYGWRNAFFLVGLPGVLLAGIVLLLREPPRGISEKRVVTTSEPVGAALLGLARTRGLLRMITGYAVFVIATRALSMWVPTFLVRVHHVALKDAGMYTGVLTGTAGLVGVLGGGAISDWLRRRGPGSRLRFSALTALLSVPLWFLLLRSSSVAGALVPFAVLVMLGLSFLGPAAADVQDLAGPSRRGIAIGVYFFFVNVIGYGIAPPVIGKLGDLLDVTHHPEAMRSSLLVCPLAALAGALLLYLTSLRVERATAS
jgi:MFS family permease